MGLNSEPTASPTIWGSAKLALASVGGHLSTATFGLRCIGRKVGPFWTLLPDIINTLIIFNTVITANTSALVSFWVLGPGHWDKGQGGLALRFQTPRLCW